MRGEGGEALDVALGLLRAPALRTALRERPLPPGVGEVLAIASGSAGGAHSAAGRTGYHEAELVEAARFYVQQILLTEDADAYRMLGTDRGADHATLRDHHRLLLRWLHPDRSPGAQWDSALSSRVNQAWNQLRTDAARAQYDQSLPPIPAPAPALVGAATAATPTPRPKRAAHNAAHIAAIAAPTGSGAALAEPTPPWRAHAAPAFVAVLGIFCLVLAWLAITRQDSLEDPAMAPRAQAAPTPAPTAHAAPAAPTPVGAAIDAIPTPLIAPDRPVEMTAMEMLGEVAAVAAPTRAVGPRESVLVEEIGIAAMAAPARAVVPAEAVLFEEREIAAIAAPTRAAPTRVAPTKAEAAPEDPMQLFLEAEDTIRGITDYLLTTSSTEPAWIDMPTRLEAAGLRSRLHTRHEGRAPRRMELDAPNWTLDSGAASMSAAYRLDARRGTVETGVLRIDLTRRDRQWRVVDLHLESAR
ncbi:J domain-containing protein [Luteimonas sp. A649]